MAPHFSILAWKIPWRGKPGRLQSMGSLGVGHDWATSLSLFIFIHWRRKWQPAPVFLLENPRGGGAWWAAVYGVAQSQTWLKWLSSSSSSLYLAPAPSPVLVSWEPHPRSDTTLPLLFGLGTPNLSWLRLVPSSNLVKWIFPLWWDRHWAHNHPPHLGERDHGCTSGI